MAEIRLVKLAGGYLAPETKADAELIETWKIGDVIVAKATRMRNPAFHKKAMALLQLVFEHQERYDNFDDLLVEFKLRAGHYKEHVTVKGTLIYIPKSISFAAMDDVEFAVLYQRWIDIALKYFLPETWDQKEVHRVMEQILGFA